MEHNSFPITPPQWQIDAWCKQALAMGADVDAVFLEAARWGGDQELLACGKYLERCAAWEPEDVTELYNYRRPKPPSLKEQALAALDDAVMRGDCITISAALPTLRRALEQLDD